MSEHLHSAARVWQAILAQRYPNLSIAVTIQEDEDGTDDAARPNAQGKGVRGGKQ